MDPRKDSVLSKDAEIFKKRDENKYEDKKNLSKEEKKAVFKQYYLKGIIIAVIVIAVVGYFLVDDFILNPSPKHRLQIGCIGIYYDQASLKDEQEKASEYLQFDGKKEDVNIDNYGADNMLETALIKFQTSYSIGEINFSVFDRENFGNISNAGQLNDITTYLDDKEKEFFKDRLVYIDMDKIPTDEDRKNDNYKSDKNVYIGKEAKDIKNKLACGILLKKDDNWAKIAESSKDKEGIFTCIKSSKEDDINKKYMKRFCEIEMEKN